MKIAIHGYGKMGQTIEKVARESGHEVVCILDVDRDEPIADAEVHDRFLARGRARRHAGARVRRQARISSSARPAGTIGSTDVKQRVEDAGIACVYASNFSPGANVVFALAQRAGELVARFPQYAAGMEERHHSQKKDAPSGTALRIAAAAKSGQRRQARSADRLLARRRASSACTRSSSTRPTT